MFFVYILKSSFKNWFYVGFSGDLEERLEEHNSGKVKSTKAFRPYVLVFAQVVDSKNEARDLEKYLKVKWNKESLIDLIN